MVMKNIIFRKSAEYHTLKYNWIDENAGERIFKNYYTFRMLDIELNICNRAMNYNMHGYIWT